MQLTNRLDTMTFTLTANVENEVLYTTTVATAGANGMPLNGGRHLHLGVDLSGATVNITMRVYLRSTPDAAWALFNTTVLAFGAPRSLDLDVTGFAVRCTADPGNNLNQIVGLSAALHSD